MITLAGLGVGTAESVATRRRTLAAQAAAGVPRGPGPGAAPGDPLPLAPGVLLAGIRGGAIGLWYAALAEGGGWSTPWAVLLVPVAVHTASLRAATTAVPLPHRTPRPSEPQYA